MTLIEILIAMGIMMLGMLGILTLFPIAIRSMSKAVNRTLGAAAAKNAIVSMSLYCIDLTDTAVYADTGVYGILDVNGDGSYDADDDFLLDADNTQWNLSQALYGFDADASHTIGHGWPDASFKLPDDLLNKAKVAKDFDKDGTVDAIPVDWHTDIGWTATFVPVPVDSDIDGYGDEDPKVGVDRDDSDGLSPYDDPVNITDQTLYAVQVAVWRNYKLFESIGANPKGTFGYQSPYVGISDVNGEFWNKVKTGDYLRYHAHGVWYQIQEVDKSNTRVKLAEDYRHAVLTDLNPHPLGTSDTLGPVKIDVASRWRLIALHDAVVGRD